MGKNTPNTHPSAGTQQASQSVQIASSLRTSRATDARETLPFVPPLTIPSATATIPRCDASMVHDPVSAHQCARELRRYFTAMTTDQGSVNAYLRTKVLTASPEELRLMLLDGALKFAAQAREGLEAGNHEQSYNGFTQCRAIITELIVSIRPEFDPELFGKVRALYTFMFSRLVDASREKSAEKLDEVIKLLQYERETWAMLMDKLNIDRQSTADMSLASAGPSSNGAAPAGQSPRRAAISVEG